MGDEAEDQETAEDKGGLDLDQDNEMSDGENEARGKGWTGEKEWKDSGKDPAEWINYGAFNKNASLFRRIGDLESQVEGSDLAMRNLNQFHKVQMDQTVKELERQMDGAVKDGDVETVTQLRKQIKQTETSAAEPDGNLLVAKWNKANRWIFDKESEKSKFANNEFLIAVDEGKSVKEVLAAVDEAVAREFPAKTGSNDDVNARRNDPSNSGGGKPRGNGSRALTMSDLTEEERKIIKSSAFADFDEKKILELVKNSRAK